MDHRFLRNFFAGILSEVLEQLETFAIINDFDIGQGFTMLSFTV